MSRGTSRHTWRARHSIAEAAANVRGSGLLAVTLIAVVAVVVGSAVVVDLVAGQSVVTAEETYLASGGDLLIASVASDTESIDAAACVRLSAVNGVLTAFALDVHTGAARLVGRPESQQTVVTATAGVVALWGLEPLGADQAMASTLIADRWQWASGSRFQFDPDVARELELPQGVIETVAVVDLDLISEGASTGVLLLRPATGTSQSCYVQVRAAYKADVIAAMPALLGETSRQSIQVVERRPAGAFAQDPASDFSSRSTRWIGAAAGAVAGSLWAVVGWTRRGRAALYDSIGVPWSGGVLIRWGEGLIVVGAGTLWGSCLGWAVAVTWWRVDPALAAAMAPQHLVAAFAAGFVLVVLAGIPTPRTLAMLKDR